MVLTLRRTDREIHQRGEEALGIDAVRMLSGEDVGQNPVVAHRRHEHGRERGMVLTPRRVLAGQECGEGVVHALELMRPDLLEQIRERCQVAQQQPVHVAFLVQAAQARARDRQEALAARQARERVRIIQVREQRAARLGLPAQPFLEERALAREVPVQPARTGGKTSGGLDLRDRRGVLALPPEQLHGRRDDGVLGAQRGSTVSS
jgi:hypothetical protein